jgi:putative Mn2+ efflux pump MntP
VGLAMDSFSVSIARSYTTSIKKQSLEALKTEFFFLVISSWNAYYK